MSKGCSTQTHCHTSAKDWNPATPAGHGPARSLSGWTSTRPSRGRGCGKKGPLSLNINTLWTGKKLNSVTTGSYIAPRVDLFVSGAYAIRKGWSVFFSARNLLNEPTDIMLPGVQTSGGAVPDHAGDYRHYGQTATLGLRAVF